MLNNNRHDNKQYLDELDKLENIVENSDKYISNQGDIVKYIDKLIDLEGNFLEDENKKEWNRIQRLHKYLNHLLVRRRDLLSSVLTMVTTIFLPLGVLVGYFGMNFRSMGVPSLKKGIFTINNAQHRIFWIALISTVIIVTGFIYYSFI